MRKFIIKISLLAAFLVVLITACLLLPPNNIVRSSLLFAQIDKNRLLQNTPGPRIIFVGGSNLSFGLNSAAIKDSLGINPVNTAVHAGIGLKYMLMNTLRYVRENDIIVVVPEYQQFFGDLSDGGVEFLTTVIDIAPGACKSDMAQYRNMLHYFPKYASSKLKLWNYFKKIDTSAIGLYDRKSFNAYGDAYIHWNLPGEQVAPLDDLKGNRNEEVIDLLVRFREMVNHKKAKLYLSFPCYQDLSFDRAIPAIKGIESRLRENKFDLLGTPERYRMADSLVFNTAYHLTKKGVDYRTGLLIEDLKKAVKPSN